MSAADLGKDLTDLIGAARLCLVQKLPLPALMLMYAGIDTAGWLAADNPSAPVKQRFTEWVDRYLLPRIGQKVTGLELYAARCGVLHTMTAVSDLSRTGAVRRLQYSFGTGPVDLNSWLEEEGFADTYGAVRIEVLLEGFEVGLTAFAEELAADPDRRARVQERARSAFYRIKEIGS